MIPLGKGLHGQLRSCSLELLTHKRPSGTNTVVFLSSYRHVCIFTPCGPKSQSLIYTFVHLN